MMTTQLAVLLCTVNIIYSTARNYLWQPEIIDATALFNSIELRVVNRTAHLRGAQNQTIASVVIRAYEYEGEAHFIGPTIIVKPNTTVNVALINDLRGVGRASAINEAVGDPSNLPEQGYRDPDVTNLHTHGLYQIYIMCSVNT